MRIIWGLGFRAPQNSGYHFRGPHKKDDRMLGSIVGSPYSGSYNLYIVVCPTTPSPLDRLVKKD